MAFEMKKNDLRPLFVVVLKDNFGESNESIVDLTTATGVVFNMRKANGGSVKINRAEAKVTNAAGGEVTYSWKEGDTDTADDFEGEVEVEWADGKPETFPSGNRYWAIEIGSDIA